MALIDCPECKKPVSTAARTCPHCGFPLSEQPAVQAQTGDPGAPAVPGDPLAEVRPSWWGFFWHLFFFWLIIPPIVASFRRNGTVIRVFPDRITLTQGILSKCYRDYHPRDIRSIDIDQSVLQRMVGIGDFTISTAATADAVQQIKSIPDPKGLRDLIMAQRMTG